MKYTLTVWIDFEADNPEEAAEIALPLKDYVQQALRHTVATAIETELAETPE